MATDGDDIVNVHSYEIGNASLDGGAGLDTLQLVGGGYFIFSDAASFKNFEVIRGSASYDRIILNDDQLAGIETIDGGAGLEDVLILSGQSVDLIGKTITGVERVVVSSAGLTLRTDSFDVASLIYSASADNDGLVLEHVTLTEAQRLGLRDRGIDRITDATGVTTINAAAQLTGLAGDRVIVREEQYALLDVGRNAVVTDDRGSIRSLEVGFRNFSQHDVNGIFFLTASDRVTYETSGPWDKEVYVDGILIGSFQEASSLSFTFNGNATPELVTEVLRAIAFQNHGQGYLPAAQATVDIRVADAGGRVTQSSMILENANDAPVGLDLIYGRIAEGSGTGAYVGQLTAGDYNWGDTPNLRYSLVDDAGGRFKIVNGSLVVADGTKIDFEQAQTHQVVIRVTDPRGLFQEKAFTITVTDVTADNPTGTERAENLVGSSGKDTLSGGGGNDSLSGGTGEDVLYGGSGNDVLRGGGSADKLYAGAGDDILFGGDGKDYLHGGSGKDAFAFASFGTKGSADKVADFSVRYDSIWLDNKVFYKLGKKGTEAAPAQLKKDFFIKGSKAKDKNDYVIYDNKKGVLYYDFDGSGKGPAIEIASLSKKLVMTYKDFFVV
jgi:Ca2+-binding RTX toxin-like protein